MQIHRIIYHSRSRLPRDAKGFAEGIQTLLEEANRFNFIRGITGALMCNAGYFAQIIEGEESVTKALYSNICRDSRHSDIRLIDESATSSRLFPEWSMTFVEMPSEEDRLLPLLSATGLHTRLSVLKVLQWFVLDDRVDVL